mgnify:CR=1 FL=1
MRQIPLFGAGLKGYSAAVSAQRRLNCFYEIRLDQDKHATIIRGTPGSESKVTLPTSPVRGWWVAAGVWYVVAGNTLYTLSSTYVAVALGTLGTSAGAVELSDNGVQLMVVDGSAGYIYTITAGTYFQTALNAAGSFAAITDANFPNGATSVAFINGRFLVNKASTRQCYMSCLDASGIAYDGTRWTDATYSLPFYFTKENSSDVLQAVDVLNGAIVLWGASTLEFWQDVGASPQPFARISGATQTWGLAAVNSRALMNNTAYFLGQTEQGGMQVMALQGYTPVRVSTTDVENLIAGFSTWTDATALSYIVDGHPMYQLNFPTAQRSFMYDSATQFWSELQTGVALQAAHFANLGITFNTKFYAADSTTGGVFELLTNVYTDNGTPIKRQVTTRHVHADGNMFTIDELLLDMETGVGLNTGQGIDPQMMLQVSHDGGRTFGVEKWRSMGAIGQYMSRVMWRRLGGGRDFVFQFTCTDPVKFTILKGSASTRQQEGAASG